jgi:hypothetical protein
MNTEQHLLPTHLHGKQWPNLRQEGVCDSLKVWASISRRKATKGVKFNWICPDETSVIKPLTADCNLLSRQTNWSLTSQLLLQQISQPQSFTRVGLQSASIQGSRLTSPGSRKANASCNQLSYVCTSLPLSIHKCFLTMLQTGVL